MSVGNWRAYRQSRIVSHSDRVEMNTAYIPRVLGKTMRWTYYLFSTAWPLRHYKSKSVWHGEFIRYIYSMSRISYILFIKSTTETLPSLTERLYLARIFWCFDGMRCIAAVTIITYGRRLSDYNFPAYWSVVSKCIVWFAKLEHK